MAHRSLFLKTHWRTALALDDIYFRHPPSVVISSAELIAKGSHRKPFTTLPSPSSIEPIESGGGTAARKLPKPPTGMAQTSSSIPGPSKDKSRIRPGLGGVGPFRA